MEVHQSLLLLLALDTLWAAGNTSETHIIGGREAAPHSRPYMASLQKAGSHVCGGVLVHPKWVLTAAHCLPESLQQLKLVLGLHHLQDLRDPGLTFHIKAAIKHPGYNRNLENDLALLKVQDGGAEGLPWPGFPQPLTGPPAVSSGLVIWAQSKGPRGERRGRKWKGRQGCTCGPWSLRQAQKLTCVPHFPQGDSGGPLVCGKGQVDGILSFSSKNCTDIFKPPVATAVAPYSPWIRKVIHR
ncbi:granzyme M isoform X1 [Cricetulus griseus]|uniref:granzyme M isoform X1 n=1 Tax=Cricetulus griseus TaxID=10029 RepID=UPI000F7376D6|nr:granzyme M isoform X1 [Cricetulus griseus]